MREHSEQIELLVRLTRIVPYFKKLKNRVGIGWVKGAARNTVKD